MKVDSASWQILLRRESYGGFVFHPHDATFVHLDPSGFSAAKQAFVQHHEPDEQATQAFLRSLRAELPSVTGLARLVELPQLDDQLAGLLTAPLLMDFQITECCDQGCPQCYAAAHPGGRHAAWEDVDHAFQQMQMLGVCQVAIGGGEPLRHPRFTDILALARDLGLVPNLTTTGMGMTRQQRDAIACHAGAVALSLEAVGEHFSLRRRQGFAAFERSVSTLLDAGVNLVLQVTLSASNLDELPAIVETALGIDPLYGLIFLAHKPAGRAVGFDAPLAAKPFSEVYQAIRTATLALRNHTRVGFDCCLSPLVAALEEDLGFPSSSVVEGCSATRGSLGLTPSLDVLPCTFLPGASLGNLRKQPLADIWNGATAHCFRQGIRESAIRHPACAGCPVEHICLGGCPAWNLVECRRKMLYSLKE